MFRSRRLILTLVLATLAATCGDGGGTDTTAAPTGPTTEETTTTESDTTDTGSDLDWSRHCDPNDQSSCANFAPGMSSERDEDVGLVGSEYGCDIYLNHFFADFAAQELVSIEPIEPIDLFLSGEAGDNEVIQAEQVIEFFAGEGLGLFKPSQSSGGSVDEQAQALFELIDEIQMGDLRAAPHYLFTPVPTWKYGPHTEVKRLDPSWTWDDLQVTGPASSSDRRVVVIDTGAIGDVSPIGVTTTEPEGAVNPAVIGHGVFAASIVKKYNPNLSVDIYRGGFLDGTLSEASVAAAINRASIESKHVLNLSLGTYPCQDKYQPIGLTLALPNLVVAASGNDGDQPDPQQMYPASHPNVTGVGALDYMWSTAPWSNPADVYAPGEDVVGWYDDGTGGSLAVWSGTSFAAPHYAACLASNQC